MRNCLSLKHNFFVPIASAIAAILTGILTFIRPSEKSETHKKAGINYEKLRHRIELILTTEYSEKEIAKKLDSIKEEWESLDAINVSNRYFLMGKEKK
ncbi:MAG: SLATT domain-containing protein [Lewinellaceae bacterium]|nr:SLATT domain-containing protein [Lewinellaceae bacterium]